MPSPDEVAASYDAVAAEYARRIAGELEGKPFDRELLTRFARQVRAGGRVLDLGCGPGHVARHLRDAGARVIGVDLSPAMIAEARRLQPDLEFRVGDMRSLDIDDASCDGIVAFYSVLHLDRAELAEVFARWRAALEPGGFVLLAFHLGEQTLHLDEWWEHRVSLDFHFYDAGWMEKQLTSAGFVIEERLERDPYAPEVEHQSRRGYILARG